MNRNDKSCKILRTAQEIMDFLGGISRSTFKKWVERGLPCAIEDGAWWAHTENLEDFFKLYTRRTIKKFPDDLERSNKK